MYGFMFPCSFGFFTTTTTIIKTRDYIPVHTLVVPLSLAIIDFNGDLQQHLRVAQRIHYLAPCDTDLALATEGGRLMRLGWDGSCRWLFEAGEEIVGLHPIPGGLLLSLEGGRLVCLPS